jgi:hypothetical protein
MALSKFLLHAGVSIDVKKPVAEKIPAFCKKERRLKGMNLICINVGREVYS